MLAKALSVRLVCLVLVNTALVMNAACSEPQPETKARKETPHKQIPVLAYVPDPDTLRVEDDFARSPFLLDSISLGEVRKLMGTNVQVKKTPTRNHFVKNQTDTLITLQKNGSYITLYAVSAEPKCFFKEAAINDPLPIFQYDLKIGQRKAEVKNLFPALKREKYLPDNIEIGATEGADYIYLIFKNDVLKRVDFKPYLD